MQTDDRIQEILAQASQASRSGEEGEDGFDANEYVKDLIARMSGTEEGASLAAASAAPSPPPAKPKESIEERVERSLEAATVPTQMLDGELDAEDPFSKPRSQSALPVDIEQLREAANITSSNDLLRSGRQDVLRSCSLNFILAASSITISLVLLSMSSGRFSNAYWSSIGMAFLAACSAYRFYQGTSVLASFDAKPSVSPSEQSEPFPQTEDSAY